MDKMFHLYLLFALFFTSGVIAFADQPNSALDDKPSVDTAADTHTSYLYDLKKLIEKSRENIKEVNQKIKEQAVLKRNQKREERARAYYEKGVALTNEGKFDEARDYFEKAIRITEHPEMTGYIKESQRRLKKQEAALQAQGREHYHQIKHDENARKEDVEAAYKQAVDLYKQKKYHPAKDAFEHVDEIAPDYRATGSYLKIIDQNIITADALAAKQQAVEITRQQKEAEAARAKEKQMWLVQIAEKEKERKEAINKQAEDVYGQAVELYKNRKFAEAKKKFEEVSWVIPNYKATMKYLGRIDKDAQVEQERAARQQQKALQEQRWEEEVEHKKQEVLRQRELKAKELQHIKDLQEQAQFLYTPAVNLFNKKNMDEALLKFNDIEKLIPSFKSTRVYIARIEQWKIDQPKRLLEAQVENLRQKKLADERRQAQEIKDKVEKLRQQELAQEHQRTQELRDKAQKLQKKLTEKQRKAQELKDKVEKLRQQKLADERQRARELKDKTDQAQKIYALALQSYRDHHWEESRAQFESVEKMIPNFKHTRRYLQKVEIFIAKAAKVKSAVVAPSSALVEVMPAQVKVAVSLEDQQKQARDITALAEKSAQLYRQIADVADDRSTAQTKKKMAKVERLLFQMREKESKRQQEEHRAEAKKMYQGALEYLRSHDYAKAKIEFLALENIIPDYKATRRYLSRIAEYQKQAGVEALTAHEQKEAEQLKQLQDKENAEQLRRTQKEQEEQHEIERQQQAILKGLAQKASAINDDIIRLVPQKDYGAMKAKFTELEDTVTALTALKDEMAKQKDRQERERQRQKKLTEELERQKRLYEVIKPQPAAVVPPAMTAEQLQEHARQAKIKAKAAARQKLKEERQAKIKTKAEAREKIKEEKQKEEEAKRRQELERQERQHQAQLEAQREAVRKQLEDGIEAMYQKALSLYQQGEYTAAADKFKDVQGILPGYKRSGQYMDEARQKSLNPQPVNTPKASEVPASPSVSRQDSISKALDLFDLNAK